MLQILKRTGNWLNENNHAGAELENASDRYSQLAVQGPNALTHYCRNLTKTDLQAIPSFYIRYR